MNRSGEAVSGRLVLGDDQSESADVAWLWIVSHPWPGWQVEVVSAVPEGTRAGEAGADASDAGENPRRFPEGVADPPAVRHTRTEGSPRDVLAAYRGHDLLVVGPRGRGWRKSLHIGSTSDALLRDPPAPLLIARRGIVTSRVLVCANGSDPSLAAMRALQSMPWVGQTEVIVATVPESGMDAHEIGAWAAAALGDGPREVRAEVLVPSPLQASYHPLGMLLEAATRWEVDLIVLGTRRIGGVAAALTGGSIATSLASRATCSVLVAPVAPAR